MRPLRISASIAMLPGLVGGVALIAVPASRDAPIPITMAALDCIVSAFVMMFLALPMIQLGHADSFLFVRSAGLLRRVNLSALNTMDTYRLRKAAICGPCDGTD